MTATVAIEAAGAVIGRVPLPLWGAGAPMIDARLGRGALTPGADHHGAHGPHDRVAAELGRDVVQLVFLHADICRRELDVEIEGHAWAEGELA